METVALACLLVGPGAMCSAGATQPGVVLAEPVIRCGVRDGTEDKPQSKVWYGKGCWWAWLPSGAGGGRIWKRTGPGTWRAERHLDYLAGALPGRADVWAGQGRVVAALMAGDGLAVASLRWNERRGRYEPDVPPRRWRAASPVETVTLDRDAFGGFWVAYPVRDAQGKRIVVRRLPRSLRWPPGPPIVLAEGVGNDDICGLVTVGQAVGVMWSDQRKQEVRFRRHLLGGPDSAWQPVEVVAAGRKTADDHINFSRPPLGSGAELLAVTKTSLDAVGRPIFSLRVLAGGRWRSVGFGTLTRDRDLTRPILLWVGGRPVCVYTCRSPYRRAKRGRPAPYSVIEAQEFPADCTIPTALPTVLIRAQAFLNNVTGPKAASAGVPCVVLASDAAGGIYEGILGR